MSMVVMQAGQQQAAGRVNHRLRIIMELRGQCRDVPVLDPHIDNPPIKQFCTAEQQRAGHSLNLARGLEQAPDLEAEQLAHLVIRQGFHDQNPFRHARRA
ncbi:hypothetical protein GCM10010909_21310 [Acidocella aquatica]|uniref:Uncharacterized protein n=1 Tax=Acidocella aquatica TaxID=1922313 RepID=A0ABQ6A4N7_9PROT|nr:hypothetical protein GCM10010909_21310 [Acidocella aquatica]